MGDVRYGILLPGDELAVDLATGRPETWASRAAANRAIARELPPYLRGVSCVVRVAYYAGDNPSNPESNGLPSYVVRS